MLTRNGVNVTVFDRHPEIGGLLMFGIPEFKLEKEVVQHRRKIFEEMGITFKLNVEVGKDRSHSVGKNDVADARFSFVHVRPRPVDGLSIPIRRQCSRPGWGQTTPGARDG